MPALPCTSFLPAGLLPFATCSLGFRLCRHRSHPPALRPCPRVSPLSHKGHSPRSPCSFRLGRQEDAHEFLIALLDAMHEASIAHMQPKPPPEVAHTSFIYRIFGGRMRSQVGAIGCAGCGADHSSPLLPIMWGDGTWPSAGSPVLSSHTQPRSGLHSTPCPSPSLCPPPHLRTPQVKCSECGYESNTYDPCIDLSLEITRAQTVKRALERFTAGEWNNCVG